MKRLLCLIGIHDWKEEADSIFNCTRCKGKKVVIQAIMESDLADMAKRGDISFKGYVNALKKGYVDQESMDMKDDWSIK